MAGQGALEEFLKAHHKIVTELQAENEELRKDIEERDDVGSDHGRLLAMAAKAEADLARLKANVAQAIEGHEGSYALMSEAFRKLHFLVASDETYIQHGPAKPVDMIAFSSLFPIKAMLDGAAVIVERPGAGIRITSDKLKRLGEYLLAVHLFNEGGRNEDS